jgi:hypothetical protein
MKKIVDFAYPTSTTATRYKMPDTGCFILYLLDDQYKRKDIAAFKTKEEAIKHGETLPHEWHWMHLKYN